MLMASQTWGIAADLRGIQGPLEIGPLPTCLTLSPTVCMYYCPSTVSSQVSSGKLLSHHHQFWFLAQTKNEFLWDASYELSKADLWETNSSSGLPVPVRDWKGLEAGVFLVCAVGDIEGQFVGPVRGEGTDIKIKRGTKYTIPLKYKTPGIESNAEVREENYWVILIPLTLC